MQNGQPKTISMNMKDFRIGNYISMDPAIIGYNYCVVTLVCGDKLEAICPKGEISGSDYGPIPIPLTEEWLVKLGFEKYHLGYCFIKKYHEQGELLIFNSETPVAKANGIKEGEYYFLFHRIIHAIQFVHQLQNLYYALTGEELTINP